MLSKIAIVTAFSVVVAHDIKTQIKAHKAAQLYLKAHQAYEETETVNHGQINYLIHLLIENGIEPTEFDLIALNFNNS